MDSDEKQQHYEIAARLIAEQNFVAAAVAGAIAALLAAVMYGIATTLWSFSYGFAAAGIGIIVGFAMQYLGRGIDTRFSILAAAYTIAGCFLGNVARAFIYEAKQGSRSPLDVLRDQGLSGLAERAVSYISLVDFVFWFVAVFFATFLVQRALSRSEKLSLGLYRMKT